MRYSIKTILNYVAVSVIFLGALSWHGPLGQFRVFYIIMAVVLLFWLPFLKGIHFSKSFLLLFTIVSLASAYNVLVDNNTMALFVKQFVGILSNAIFFYLLIKVNRYDIKSLFNVYLNLAFIVALIGVVQEVSFLLKFEPGYDYTNILPWWRLAPRISGIFIRVNSVLPEPTDFCYAIIPAFFVAVMSFINSDFKLLSRIKGAVIIITYLFTFSSVGFIGVFFIILLLMINYNRPGVVAISILLILALFNCLYVNVIEFSYRLDDSVDILMGRKMIDSVNLSTYALYSNAVIAYRAFMENPICGAGLGSHEVSYFRNISRVIDINEMQYAVNYNDANSMFLRLLSETGLLGLLIILVFFFRFYIARKKDTTGYLWIINNAVLCTFFIRLVRYGHYFVIGTFFFFWIYYFSKIKLRAITAGY